MPTTLLSHLAVIIVKKRERDLLFQFQSNGRGKHFYLSFMFCKAVQVTRHTFQWEREHKVSRDIFYMIFCHVTVIEKSQKRHVIFSSHDILSRHLMSHAGVTSKISLKSHVVFLSYDILSRHLMSHAEVTSKISLKSHVIFLSYDIVSRHAEGRRLKAHARAGFELSPKFHLNGHKHFS